MLAAALPHGPTHAHPRIQNAAAGALTTGRAIAKTPNFAFLNLSWTDSDAFSPQVKPLPHSEVDDTRGISSTLGDVADFERRV